MSKIRTWLDNALLQSAAESYLVVLGTQYFGSGDTILNYAALHPWHD